MFRDVLTLFFVAALATGLYALPAVANHHEAGGGHEGHEEHPPAEKPEGDAKAETEGGDHGDHRESPEGMGDDNKGHHEGGHDS